MALSALHTQGPLLSGLFFSLDELKLKDGPEPRTVSHGHGLLQALCVFHFAPFIP